MARVKTGTGASFFGHSLGKFLNVNRLGLFIFRHSGIFFAHARFPIQDGGK